MDTHRFNEAYKRLNPSQKEAVDTIEGPVMVIAGPGTGKTQILTLRIANILQKTDTQPENILALTFTESGSRAMRERLASYIGAPGYRVRIHTFHEFAGECIRNYPEAYGRAALGKPIPDLEKIRLIESILDTPDSTHLRPRGNPELYVKPIIDAISLMKREYVTPDRFKEAIDAQEAQLGETPKIHEKGAHKGKVRGAYIDLEKRVNRNKELLFVYRAYESALAEQRQFDYDDMIYETVLALRRDENMLRSLQEQYHYILADEHQDVNGSQNAILELLASFHERPNLFVVGDEKQSIYRFQGASLENFLFFEEKFPHTKTIALTRNYRSTQNILDLAHELIAVDAVAASALRVPLTADAKDKGIIERCHFSHEGVEHEYVAEKIHALITQKVLPCDIAVIVRTNREVEECSSYLRGRGIMTESSADGDILSHPLTTSIRTLIEAVADPADERALFGVLHSGYVGLSADDLVKIAHNRSYTEPLARIIGNREILESIGVRCTQKVLTVGTVLTEARKRMTIDAPHRVLERLLRDIGFLDHALSLDAHEASRVIRRLYDEIEEMVRTEEKVTLRDIEAMLRTHAAYGISLTAPYIHTSRRAVQVMTAHKAKGLEFLHVFIPHATDNRWGGARRTHSFDIPVTTRLASDAVSAFDDERKLFYVALTRAKVGLYLLDSETSTEGRSLLPTRLLEGVGAGAIATVDVRAYEEKFNPLSPLLSARTEIGIDTAFLREVLTERGLSATALNNYLKDPWNYFYRNVLRIPEVQSESAQFGTAVHDTLRCIMKHRRDHGALPSPREVKTYLERELGKLPLTANELTRHHARGFEVLLAYMEHIKNDLPFETKEEFKIQAVLETGDADLPEILLTGMLDRLDFNEEGTLMRVIDYKSGKPQTRGKIEGTTKDSDGNYKRQLTFYALLLSLHDDPKYYSREGMLSFVEPDGKGKIHEEAYTITEGEIESLKKEIIRVAHDIAHGTFLNAPCDPEKSDYCHLAEEFRKRSTQASLPLSVQ